MYAGQRKKKATATVKQLLKSVSTLLSSGICPEKTWEAFKVLKGKRLTGSFGLLWGVKIPDTMTDDMPEGDLPYLEMLYKFVYGKNHIMT